MDNDTDMVGLWISIWARIRARSMIGCPLGIVSGCALDTHAADAGLMSRVLLTLWWSDRIGGGMGFGYALGHRTRYGLEYNLGRLGYGFRYGLCGGL
mgnify:CR=1 FL=1